MIASSINRTENAKLQNKLNKEFISLTSDFWTSMANGNYLNIIAHWIDDSWTFQNTVLQIKKVSERLTSTVCAGEFQ